MNCAGFHMSPNYIGSVFGRNTSKTLKAVKVTTTRNPDTITKLISQGLKASKKTATTDDSANFVSFFVFSQHGVTVAPTEKHMDMHVCVYTVRYWNNMKDCIYYDPSPECHRHNIPSCVRDLRYPVVRSSTRSYGAASMVEDCMYQCFKYVIGLHSGEIQFVPDMSQQHFPRI